MNRVINQKIDFVFNKNGNQKKITFKNRLTDLYLDYILFRMLPTNIANSIYPGFEENDTIINPFSYSYIKFDDTQAILDTDTTMNYDVQSEALGTDEAILKVDTNNKVMSTSYTFDLSSIPNNSLFAGIGFGRNAVLETNYLFSFINVSLASIRTTADTSFGIARYDEISTNEIILSGDGSYLPFAHISSDKVGKLVSISPCYGENGVGVTVKYNLSDLILTRLSAGVIEVTGFNDFHIEDSPLYPSNTLYPSDTLYPTNPGQYKSVIYEYLLNDGTTQKTYVNIQDLDISYQDSELKIKLICERGEY
jgi:hypothetical protein